MTVLDVRQAYRLWAPTYSENVITFLDEELAAALSPPLTGKRLLDAGCGTGRRLARDEAALAVGVDVSSEMLAAGGATGVAAADIRALPFAANEFDLVWCRLVLSYLADPTPAYRELARVCRPGGYLLVTDFHSDAVAAGHKRSFRDAAGAEHEIESYIHDGAAHSVTAARAGFALATMLDAVVGPSVEAFYVRAGRAAAYEKDKGLALVAAFLFRRTE